MSTASTHVLDAALGLPAAGMSLTLTGPGGSVEQAVTDADGRVRFAGELAAGTHTIVFTTGPWFARQDRDTFFPEVTLTFTVAADRHHHVALLLSPFAYTTYRGS